MIMTSKNCLKNVFFFFSLFRVWNGEEKNKNIHHKIESKRIQFLSNMTPIYRFTTFGSWVRPPPLLLLYYILVVMVAAAVIVYAYKEDRFTLDRRVKMALKSSIDPDVDIAVDFWTNVTVKGRKNVFLFFFFFDIWRSSIGWCGGLNHETGPALDGEGVSSLKDAGRWVEKKGEICLSWVRSAHKSAPRLIIAARSLSLSLSVVSLHPYVRP